ncbi:MAG: sugar transferase [Nocardioidaceae bacterium]
MDPSVHAGLSGEEADVPAASLQLAQVPRGGPSHSNVLQFSARHPEAGIAPVAALRRVRAALVATAAVVMLSVVASAVLLGRLELAAIGLSWFVVEAGLLHARRHLDELGTAIDVLKRHALYGMSVCVVGVLLKTPDAAFIALILLGALGILQALGLAVVRRRRAQKALGIAAPPSVLIVADSQTARQAIEDRAGVTSSTVVGVCLVGGYDKVTSVAGVPVLGSADSIVSVVGHLNIHEVAVRVESPLDSEWLRELQWSLEELGARLTLVTRLSHMRAGRVHVDTVGQAVVLGISQVRPTGIVRALKAAAESVLALVGFIVTLPLLMACAVAIKLDSRGPAFFRQTRVRDNDRTFTMLKLRTMSVDASERRADLEASNEVGGGLFKMKADPRVTRVGRVLRKLSLDELPQLLNVMRGEMSLVGPRPALPSEVAVYDDRARRRLGVKPGLTGLWQVSGRSRLSWEQSIALDIDYVDNWSAGRDVRIAIETVRAVVCKDGAY